MTKCQNYPSNTILKNAIFLAKVNKFPWGYLHTMTPHEAYCITMYVRTVILADISHK